MLDFITNAAGLPLSQLVSGAGFFILIASFAAVQFGLIDGNGNRYAALNISGAVLILLGLAKTLNFALGIVVFAWILLGFIGFVVRFFRNWDTALKAAQQHKAS